MTMTSDRISDARVAEMLTGLEGVSPGPWTSEADGFEPDADVVLYSQEPVTDEIGTLIVDGGNSQHDAKANARHIARCDPDTMRSILTELLAWRAKP